MYGDAGVSNSGDDFVWPLDMDEFHLYRYESPDGMNYTVSVDGLKFIEDFESDPPQSQVMAFHGEGGCGGDWVPNTKNEWDFVRYGTIESGERIVASDPPAGLLDPVTHADLDRFAVTFDSANYVYLDDITVQVTSGTPPVVLQTRRRENDEPDTVEIVLDRALSTSALTRFIFHDGVAVNVVEYAYQQVTDGACCEADGSCSVLTADGCPAIPGATYQGDGTMCLGDTTQNGIDDACDAGACCSTDDICQLLIPQECQAISGAEYKGDGTVCRGDQNGNGIDDACDAIPATSDWGLAVLTLLVLTAGTLILKRPAP